MDQYWEINREWWDEAAAIHEGSPLYDLESFLAGADSLRPYEAEELGDVLGLSLLHLQCHIGTDSLSWARRGARVMGYDLSERSLEVARNLARESGIAAEFVAGELYEAPAVLAECRFDVVYTGSGALNWLPDISAWADVVVSLLNPGGRLYLVEFHPFLNLMAEDRIELDPTWHYFHDPAGVLIDDDKEYAGADVKKRFTKTMEWSHHLGSFFTAILDAGLVIESFREHSEISYQRWPDLVKLEGQQRWKIAPGDPQIPLEFSLLARKPN